MPPAPVGKSRQDLHWQEVDVLVETAPDGNQQAPKGFNIEYVYSDYPDQTRQFIVNDLATLGADGLGFSGTRTASPPLL